MPSSSYASVHVPVCSNNYASTASTAMVLYYGAISTIACDPRVVVHLPEQIIEKNKEAWQYQTTSRFLFSKVPFVLGTDMPFPWQKNERCRETTKERAHCGRNCCNKMGHL
jgi:hypothetical protein